MTGDDRLRTELEALERSGPAPAPPVYEQTAPWAWTRYALTGATVLAAVAVTVFGIGRFSPTQTGQASPSATQSNGPVSAEDRNADLVLTISSPQSLWRAGEDIDVEAALSYVGNRDTTTVVSNCGPIVFSVAEVGGDGAMHPAICAACVSHRIRSGEPIVREFAKSGLGLGSLGKGFMEGSGLRLPAGTWRITASFSYEVCTDEPIALTAFIELEVADQEPSASLPLVTPCPTGVLQGDMAADANGDPVVVAWEHEPPIPLVLADATAYRFDSSGGLTLLDRDGNVVAREGDWIVLGGTVRVDDNAFIACGVTGWPTETPTPIDDDPAMIRGILRGSAELEGGCTWIRDANGVSWEIVWPDGFDEEFRNGVAVVLRDGRVWAESGDMVEAAGHVSHRYGTYCMVGIVYETREVSTNPHTETIDCGSATEADCSSAVALANPLLHESGIHPELIRVAMGRGLIWHAVVHGCWNDGREVVIDVVGPGGDVGISTRDDSAGTPTCD